MVGGFYVSFYHQQFKVNKNARGIGSRNCKQFSETETVFRAINCHRHNLNLNRNLSLECTKLRIQTFQSDIPRQISATLWLTFVKRSNIWRTGSLC